MKKWHLPFLLFLVAASVWVIRNNQEKQKRYWNEEQMVFGTVMHVTYEADSSLAAGYMAELAKVDATLSMFNPNSVVSRINRGETDSTTEMFREVFMLAKEVSEATDGAFDITVGPLVNVWGFGFKNSILPDSAQVDSLMQYVGWQDVKLVDGRIVKKEGVVMDFSAIAKGYGVDKVAEYLQSQGVTNLMVEIGGEIVCHGNNPKGGEWRIGINKPVEDSTSTNNEIEKVITMHEGAMATSGNYRNFYVTPEGRKIMHTIDPKTGYPVQNNILSSTVYAETCARADAFATAFMVMGRERAMRVVEKENLKVDFITAE